MPGAILEAKFDTRRDAQQAVEQMIQEVGIERSYITIKPKAVEAPSDAASYGGPTTELGGPTIVSVALDDDTRGAEVRAAFVEFAGSPITPR